MQKASNVVIKEKNTARSCLRCSDKIILFCKFKRQNQQYLCRQAHPIHRPKAQFQGFVTKQAHAHKRARRTAEKAEEQQHRLWRASFFMPCPVFINTVRQKGDQADSGAKYQSIDPHTFPVKADDGL